MSPSKSAMSENGFCVDSSFILTTLILCFYFLGGYCLRKCKVSAFNRDFGKMAFSFPLANEIFTRFTSKLHAKIHRAEDIRPNSFVLPRLPSFG